MYDDVSKLLKEAKPLYFTRKRRNNQIKTALCMFVGVLMLGMFYSGNDSKLDAYGYFFIDNNISMSENSTSVVEEMGLPTDDYGLLMVG